MSDSGGQTQSEHPDRSIRLRFWGVHGTLPVPGRHTTRYGGNTSCVTMALPGGRVFIFDAGSGIRNLSEHLLLKATGPICATIFISHPHWDHINALPFFAPLYDAEHRFHICGPAQGQRSIQSLIAAQMDEVYFPVTMDAFHAEVSFQDLLPGEYCIDGVRVLTERLVHPGFCIGYRVEYAGRALCYMTDNELFPSWSASYSAADRTRLERFARGADALITDCTYFDEEYRDRQHWGHSCVSEVADFAHRAGVGTLYLFHHDVGHNDADIDRKQALIEERLQRLGSATVCVAAAEGQGFSFTTSAGAG